MSSKLVDKIISHQNSTFSEEDRPALMALPTNTLKRMAVGLQSVQDVPITNADIVEARKADLTECQKDLVDLVAIEQGIRQELESFGVQTSSVLKQFIPVHNQAQHTKDTELTEQEAEDMLSRVRRSNTMPAMVVTRRWRYVSIAGRSRLTLSFTILAVHIATRS